MVIDNSVCMLSHFSRVWLCAMLWDFFGRNDAKAETPVLWPPHAKSWLIGKDSDAGRDCGQEEKGTTEDEMAGWHHWLDGRESEWTLGVGDGQEAWRAVIHGVAKSRTRLSDWTELMDCNLPGSSVHGILQVRILEWVAMPSSRGSSQPRDQTQVSYVSCICRQVLFH